MYWRRPVFFMYARISSVDDGILLYFVDFARSLSGGKNEGFSIIKRWRRQFNLSGTGKRKIWR